MGIGNSFPIWGSGIHSLLFSDVVLAGLSKTTWSRPRRRSFHYGPPKKNPPLCNVYGRPFPSWRLAATFSSIPRLSPLSRMKLAKAYVPPHQHIIRDDGTCSAIGYHPCLFVRSVLHFFVWIRKNRWRLGSRLVSFFFILV